MCNASGAHTYSSWLLVGLQPRAVNEYSRKKDEIFDPWRKWGQAQGASIQRCRNTWTVHADSHHKGSLWATGEHTQVTAQRPIPAP
jgi:hypothetical protein